MRALVTGATGYVGSLLVPDLLAAGVEVTALSRSPERLAGFGWARQVRTVRADLLDTPSTRRALLRAGPVDVAYYLVHALEHGDYEERDDAAAAHFADAARRAGVRRIVYLGGFVPDEARLSRHLRSRASVARVLTAGGVDTVALQAAAIIGVGSAPFEIIRSLVDRLPVVPLPPFMRKQVQPIAIDDVLHYLRHAADPAVLPAGSYDIAGERITTYAGLVRTYAAVARLRRVFVPVPFVPAQSAAAVVGPLTPVENHLVTSLMPSLSNQMLPRDLRIRNHIPDPFGGLTGIEESIARALDRPLTLLAQRD
jgi:uncharacterized protein YbjT (DUF2867 family)